MIYYLLFTLIIILIINLVITKDFFSPASSICYSYLLAVSCAIINIDNWDINLKSKTYLIIASGVFVFVVVSIMVNLYYKKNGRNKSGLKEVKYSKKNLRIIELVCFGITVLYTYYFFKVIGGVSNFKNFSEKMMDYRLGTAYGDYLENSIPSFINQLTKVVCAYAYIVMYIFLNNLISKKEVSKYETKSLIISIMMYFPIVIFSGGRSDIIVYFLAFITLWYILFRKKTNYKPLDTKNIRKIVIIIVMIMALFSISRGVVGRTSEESIVGYVSKYFGGSIKLLDMYIENPVPKSEIWGKETFFGINKLMYQMGIIEKSYKIHLEFRIVKGKVLGNVYTALRRLIQDFGFSGMIFFQALFAFIINKWYYSCALTERENEIDLKILVYAMISYTMFLQSYSEYFYNAILSWNFFAIVICIMIIKFWISKVKI